MNSVSVSSRQLAAAGQADVCDQSLQPARPSSKQPSTMPAAAAVWIQQGSPAYRKAGLALFLLGFASFSMIYCVQPLLPAFSQSFAISPASSSLALSLTTGLLAVSIVLSSAFSQALGRRGLMLVSMLLAALLNILLVAVPGWHSLLLARALEGLVLGGVPAVAMAWIAEEIAPQHVGSSMGLYIAGTAFGGMMGRVGMGLLTEYFSWRFALGALGVLCLLCAIGFYLLLPPSRHFVAKKGLNLRFHGRAWLGHVRHAGLLRLYAVGFLLTSIFVSLLNYATFRLAASPYSLSPTQISLIFLSYSVGMLCSSRAGGLALRWGKRRVMAAAFALMLAGILCTLAVPLWLLVSGIGLLTSGFFIAHAIASSEVGLQAADNKGHATSLYLLFYYMGSSIVGSVGGWFWQHAGWPGIAGLTAVLAVLGLLLSVFALSFARQEQPV